jgi:hypothetical protein
VVRYRYGRSFSCDVIVVVVVVAPDHPITLSHQFYFFCAQSKMTIQTSIITRSKSPGPRRRSCSVQPRRGRSMIRREDPRDRHLTPAPMKYSTTPPTSTGVATATVTTATSATAGVRGRHTIVHRRASSVTSATTHMDATIVTTSTALSTQNHSAELAIAGGISPTSSTLSSSTLSRNSHSSLFRQHHFYY